MIKKLIPIGMIHVSVYKHINLLFKCANHRNKRPFVLTANEVMDLGTLMIIADVNNIFTMGMFLVTSPVVINTVYGKQNLIGC